MKNKVKIRNGFVSNSSSSSFILIGCKLSKKEIAEKLNISSIDNDDVWEKIEELDLFWSLEDDVIGYLVADHVEEYYDGIEINITKVMEKAKLISEKLSVPIEEVKLMTGVRSC